MYHARIMINNQSNDGNFSKSFLIKMVRMGALVTVHVMMYKDSSANVKTNEVLYLENDSDFLFFKNLNG